MELFGERLKDLMEEGKVDAKFLGSALKLTPSIIYQWQKSEKGLLISSAIRLADFFKCTLEYLIGREAEYRELHAKPCPPFCDRLRQVLADKKISQYRFLKDTNLSRGNLNSWFNNRSTPNIESVIRIADYLKITVDELVGRE